MKPFLIFKTTAGQFKTTPKWFYYILVTEVRGKGRPDFCFSTLAGLRQDTEPAIPCETD